MLVTGALVVIVWIASGLGEAMGIYEIIPGFIAAWLAICAASLATARAIPKPAKE